METQSTTLSTTKLFQACMMALSLSLFSACGGSDNNDSSTDTGTGTTTDTTTGTDGSDTGTGTNTDGNTDTGTGDDAGNSTDTGTTTGTGTTEESFVFPFRKGETWTICQGYNTSSITHHGDLAHSLDLSIDENSASGSTGCNFSTADASTGYKVVAPVAGSVLWDGLTLGIGSDVVCLQLAETAANNANSMLLGHITLDGLSAGDSVTMGQEIGTVNGPATFNGAYAHIHISMHESNTCQGESIALGDVFDGDHNFTSDGSAQQWRGTKISR